MRRKLLDIAYEYGRSCQSSQTGYLHFGDKIPLYENLLFALVLMQTKTVENTLEAIQLVEKLLQFQTPSGYFPRHLHEYPIPAQSNHQVELYDILKRFAPRFDVSSLREAIQKQKNELHPAKQYLFDRSVPWQPTTLRTWEEYLKGGDSIRVPQWNASLMVCTEETEMQEWEESLPLPTFIDLYMASLLEQIPSRLQKGSRAHLSAALLPYQFPEYVPNCQPYSWVGSTLYVGSADKLYPLTLETKGSFTQDDEIISLTLSEEDHPEDQDRIEFRFYFPYKESGFLINGEKQNTFSLDDTLTLKFPNGEINLRFSLEEGAGDFMGHVTRFDRPGQKQDKNQFVHYDYCLTVRSLRRTARAVMSLQASVGLSEASPIACSPLST